MIIEAPRNPTSFSPFLPRISNPCFEDVRGVYVGIYEFPTNKTTEKYYIYVLSRCVVPEDIIEQVSR